MQKFALLATTSLTGLVTSICGIAFKKGMQWHSCSKYSTKIWKVVGSIPDEVIGIFQ
jgi:hypothetical protein